MNSFTYNALTITAVAALTLSGCASGAVYWGSPSVDEQVLALDDMPDPMQRTAKSTAAREEPRTPGSRRTPSTSRAPSDSPEKAPATSPASKPKEQASSKGTKMSDRLRGSDASPEVLAKLKEAEAAIDSDIKLADDNHRDMLNAAMNDVVKRLEGVKDAPREEEDMAGAQRESIVQHNPYKKPAADTRTTTVQKPTDVNRRLPKVNEVADVTSQESAAELARKYRYKNTGAGLPGASNTAKKDAAPAAIHRLASTLDVQNPLRPKEIPPKPLPTKLYPPESSPVDYSVRQVGYLDRIRLDKKEPPKSEDEPEAAPVPGAWKERVRAAILEMQREVRHREKTGKTISGQAQAEEQIKLRMLYLLMGERHLAFTKFTTMNKERQLYWQQQLYALDAHFNPKGSPLHDRRAATALRYLRQSVAHLASLSRLEVRNLQFCTAVDSFGRFTTFKKNEFKPNQEVLLYAEIDSFQSNTSEKGGYETKLKGSYEIFNIAGERIADFEYPVDEEHCTSRHRDFFVPFRVYMPKFINAGEYSIKLTVRDELADKFGQSEIKFKIVR